METKGGTVKSFYVFGKYPLAQSKVKMILGMAIVLLLLLTLASCQHTYRPVQVRTRPARTLYLVALKKAQEWKPDAYLDNISVGALLRDNYTRPILLFFGFDSPSDDRHSLMITFRSDLDEPEIEQVYFKMANAVHDRIDSEDWPLDSVDALSIAQANGGDEFLSYHNSGPVEMDLYLERRPFVPGATLRWRASYFDELTGDYLRVMLDPQTGKVIGTEWHPSR